jgi:hypothetical protein
VQYKESSKNLTPRANAVEGYRSPRREACSGAQLLRQVLECASPLALFRKAGLATRRAQKRQRAIVRSRSSIESENLSRGKDEHEHEELPVRHRQPGDAPSTIRAVQPPLTNPWRI